MKVVADANALLSALIRAGLTRQIWFCPDVQLVAPSYILREFLKHREEAREKFKGSDEEFGRIETIILKQLELVDDSALRPYIPDASELSEDPDDWLYLACALRENAAIWTHDKDFSGQLRVRILSTKELAEELGLF